MEDGVGWKNVGIEWGQNRLLCHCKHTIQQRNSSDNPPDNHPFLNR